MNESDLKTMLSKPAIAVRNPKLIYATNHPSKSSKAMPKLERSLGHEPLEPPPIETGDPKRYLVCITNVKRRLYDVDNICEKYHVDALRYTGQLPSDAPTQTEIRTTQRKAEKGEEEHALIEVYEL